MCHSRKFYHKINRLQKKCLRIIYNDKTSSYEELLSKDGSVSMHHKNLQKTCHKNLESHQVLSFPVSNSESP